MDVLNWQLADCATAATIEQQQQQKSSNSDKRRREERTEEYFTTVAPLRTAEKPCALDLHRSVVKGHTEGTR